MRPTITRKLARAFDLPTVDLLLVMVCWAMIGASSLLVALLPTRRILRRLGDNIGSAMEAPLANPRQERLALRISQAIAMAANNAPFRADCYPQALVAAQWCRWLSIPYVLQLGARFAAGEDGRPGPLEGHAWVRTGSLTLCGGTSSAQEFGTVASFVHVPRRTSGVIAG